MKIDAKSPEGNGWFIMGAVKGLLFVSGREKDWPDAERRMKSGDYANLCRVASEVTFGSIEVVNHDPALLNEAE